MFGVWTCEASAAVLAQAACGRAHRRRRRRRRRLLLLLLLLLLLS
jgi:hypothetical protein